MSGPVIFRPADLAPGRIVYFVSAALVTRVALVLQVASDNEAVLAVYPGLHPNAVEELRQLAADNPGMLGPPHLTQLVFAKHDGHRAVGTWHWPMEL